MSYVGHLSGFIIFHCYNFQLTKIIGEEWNALSDELKKPYLEAAELDKERYESEYILCTSGWMLILDFYCFGFRYHKEYAIYEANKVSKREVFEWNVSVSIRLLEMERRFDIERLLC